MQQILFLHTHTIHVDISVASKQSIFLINPYSNQTNTSSNKYAKRKIKCKNIGKIKHTNNKLVNVHLQMISWSDNTKKNVEIMRQMGQMNHCNVHGESFDVQECIEPFTDISKIKQILRNVHINTPNSLKNKKFWLKSSVMELIEKLQHSSHAISGQSSINYIC